MLKKGVQVEKKYDLTDKSIDEISEETGGICTSFGMDSRDIYRHRLTVEECLLDYQRAGFSDQEIVLQTCRRFFLDYLEIRLKGKAYNPIQSMNSTIGYGQIDLLSYLKLVPEYYRDGEWNVLRFRLTRKRLSSFAVLLLVILVSILVGFGGKAVLPDAAIDILLTFIISPLYDIFFNAIKCLAGPMIFLAITVGIYGIGDISTFGRIGRKTMITYALGTFLFTAFGVLADPFLGTEISDKASVGAGASDIVEMFKDIVPSSVVTPFAEGNTLQIIFMAVICGIALLYLDKRAGSLAKAVEQANSMIQLVMSTFCKAMPFFMAVIFIDIIWTGSGEQFGSTWLLVLVGIIFSLLITLLAFIVFAIMFHVRPSVLLKKSIPAYLVAIMTASSTATFQANFDTCTNGYGVDKSIAGFGLPLGMIMSKGTASMYYLIVSLFMADQFDVSISIGWLIIAVISCTLVAMAVPPVPGGGTCAYMVIFSQLGIPGEAISIAIAVELIMDHITTSSDMIVMPLMLTKAADSIGAVDKKVISRE